MEVILVFVEGDWKFLKRLFMKLILFIRGKILLSLMFCFCYSLKVSAQIPVNDNCTGATVLISNTTCITTAGTLVNATRTIPWLLSCGNLNSPDVWYQFVAKSAYPTITLSAVGSAILPNIRIQLLSGSCASFTDLGCNSGSVLPVSNYYPTGLTVGVTYYIRIATNSSLASYSTNASFNICVTDLAIDYSKSYINITDGAVGGTINPGDVLEIRSTFVVTTGGGALTNFSYFDTLKNTGGLRYKDSIALRTNEGKNYKWFTNAVGDDAGWFSTGGGLGLDTAIQINIGTGATAAIGGTVTNTSRPSFYGGTYIVMATYRVTVYGAFDNKINFGGGAFRFTTGSVNYTINFPRDSLRVYQTLSACSDAVSPGNLIGSASNGTFGTLPLGSVATNALQNGGPAAINTTYGYQTFATGPVDYYYGVANNTSPTNAIDRTVIKTGGPTRVFGIWDITGDHTNSINPAKGNNPCDISKPVSVTNPCGYLLAINAAYRSDKVFEYTATGVCSETYYEVSAWFKNLCYRCGCDSMGRGAGNVGYIPTAPPPAPGLSSTPGGDSSGVRPNIAMQIDGIDYYTTGELVYQGLGGTQTGSDTLNNWVRRSFVFKTSPTQTSFKITFRNNAPGGGGNDWAIDDIGLRTCYPSMVYAPSNPIVFMGSSLTIRDTVRSYFDNYTWYKWQTKPANGPFAGTWIDVVPAATGNFGTPPLVNGQYEYTIAYTIPGTATQLTNAGDAYRMVVASNASNLANGCNFVPSTTFTLLPTDAPCAFKDTNYAVAPQTGNINWNKLNWSLGHVPTCCESAHITYNGTKGSADVVVVDITNDICIINLTLLNTSTTSDQLFKTILHPGFNMQMNGNVRMGASGTSVTDSCIFIARGGGTITVNGNTVIGYPTDNAYSILGSSPDIALNHNYVLKGDSLTFNNKSFTSDKFITVIMNPILDTAYFVNNTNTVPYPNAVTFENFKIGNASKLTTVIAVGTNQNSFMNNRGGALEVTSNATLVLPANNTINARLPYNSSLQLRPNSNLRIGGFSGGTLGSNFPANFTLYNADPTSLTEYYGGNLNPQTVYGMTYGKLELRNGTNALGTGRAQKNSTAPIGSTTSINVNQQTDFTLGTLGSSTQTVASGGLFNLTAGSGLYCNANVVSGAGTFTMGNGSFLGMGHAQGISLLGNATGNNQMTGARNFNTTGNYIYNGLVTQITGDGLPTLINDLTIDNPTTVTIASNQTVNGVDLLKQGTFDIGTTKITHNGVSILNSVTGKMKADFGTVEMKGTTGIAQNLSGNWFLNKTISSLINANSKGITVAPVPADTLLISTEMYYGPVTNSAIITNDNLTFLSRSTATARFGEIVTASGNTITGKVNIERYLFARKSWRLLAAPVVNGTSPFVTGSWREAGSLASTGYGTQITGPASYFFMDATTQRSSMKSWNATSNVYVDVTNTNTTNISNAQGYYVFVRGDRAVPVTGAAAATNLRIKGDILTGNQIFNVPAGKFQTFGNPYPSRIDFRTVTKSSVTASFITWNPNSPGSYNVGGFETYTFDGTNYLKVPGGTIRNFIESGEAVFVQSNAGAGIVTVKESDKVAGSAAVSRSSTESRAGVTAPTLEINMYSRDVDNSTYLADGILMNFDDSYSNAIDNMDVRKISNTADNLAIKNGNFILVVERRPNIIITDTIKMNLANTHNGPYRFEIDPSVLNYPDVEAILNDKFLGTKAPVSLNAITNYTFDITADAASKVADRFMITFKQVPPMRFTSITAVRNADNTATVKWNTENENNINYYTIEHSVDAVNFSTVTQQLPTANNFGNPYYNFLHAGAVAGNNWYRVKSNAINGSVQYTSIVKLGPVALVENPSITIYPNPATKGTVNIYFTNKPTGTYQLKITNKLGQILHVETIQLQSTNLQKTIKFNAAAGIYDATIIEANNNTYTIPFLIK